MKVIFLDVDGVLNHSKTSFEDGEVFILDDDCIRQLQRIVLEADAEIVLSSTWRYSPSATAKLAWKLMDNFGLTLFSKTPKLPEGLSHRHHEIRRWLQDQKDTIEKIAILDDDVDACLEEKPETFFNTSFENGGLTEHIADKVIKHLNV